MSERLGWAPVVLGAMLGCIALAVARLIAMAADLVGLTSGWYPAYMVAACGLAALEAYYGRRLRQRSERSGKGPEGWKLVALEVLAFLVLLKAGSYVGDSLAEIKADVLSWVGEPTQIFDGETAMAAILAFLSWLAYTKALDALEQLKEPPEFWSDAQSGALGLPVPQARLAGYYLAGGVLLLAVTGLIWVGAHADQGWAGLAVLWDRSVRAAPVPAWSVMNVLVYFLLGLVMVSQVRLVALRQDWQVRKTGVSNELSGTWWRYSLVFVGLAALVALLLPTAYTQGLLDVLRYGLSTVLRVLYVVAATLVVAILTPFFLLARWLMGDEVTVPEAPPMTSARPMAPPPSAGGPAWLGMVRAAFFWVAMLGLAIYLVRAFLREHPEVRKALASFDPLRWLVRLWKAWRARFGVWQAALRTRRRQDAQDGEDGEGEGETRARRHAPEGNRGWVLHTYWELLRRARRAGIPRGPAQTPRVYGVTLKQAWPENREQVELVTEAFVEARYSRHRIGAEIVRRVRASWRQIRQLGRRQT